jgi:hypothetical protein
LPFSQSFLYHFDCNIYLAGSTHLITLIKEHS